MATDNVVYELVHQSTQLGVEVDNVYYYQRGTGITANAQALVEEWQEQVLPTITTARGTDVVTQQISARNIFDATDVFILPLSEAGGFGGGDLLPPHDAVNFTLVRENATTRNGSKRMASIQEASQVDGILTDSTFLTAMAALADVFVDVILGTLSAEWFFPVIVGRIPDGDGYRLPETLLEATVNAIIDAVFNPDVSTQTSRKIGNGA